jgi:hypothetical protein
MPKNLEEDDIYLIAATALEDNFLAEADDEALMRKNQTPNREVSPP